MPGLVVGIEWIFGMKGKVELARDTEVEICCSILEAEFKETIYSYCQQRISCMWKGHGVPDIFTT